MVQIAAPSRTRIPSYADLRRRVEETVERINARFQTVHWRPIVLIDRQCNHEEVNPLVSRRRRVPGDFAA